MKKFFSIILSLTFIFSLKVFAGIPYQGDEIIGTVNGDYLSQKEFNRLLNVQKKTFSKTYDFDLFSKSSKNSKIATKREEQLKKAKNEKVTVSHDEFSTAWQKTLDDFGGIENIEKKGKEHGLLIVDVQKKLEDNLLLSKYFEKHIKEKLLVLMVDELLVLQEAKIRGLEVPEELIEQKLDLIKEKKGGELAFKKVLMENNATIEEAREEIKNQFLYELVIESLQKELKSSDKQRIKDYFNSKKLNSRIVFYDHNANKVNPLSDSQVVNKTKKEIKAKQIQVVENIDTAPTLKVINKSEPDRVASLNDLKNNEETKAGKELQKEIVNDIEEVKPDMTEAKISEREIKLVEKETKARERESLLAEKEAKVKQREAFLAQKEAEEKLAKLAQEEAKARERESILADKEAKIKEKEALLAQKEAEEKQAKLAQEIAKANEKQIKQVEIVDKSKEKEAKIAKTKEKLEILAKKEAEEKQAKLAKETAKANEKQIKQAELQAKLEAKSLERKARLAQRAEKENEKKLAKEKESQLKQAKLAEELAKEKELKLAKEDAEVKEKLAKLAEKVAKKEQKIAKNENKKLPKIKLPEIKMPDMQFAENFDKKLEEKRKKDLKRKIDRYAH